MTPAVISDADGTLWDVSGIKHFVEDDPKHRDFDSFHKASLFCPPNPAVLEAVLKAAKGGFAILVVTARDERYRDVTADWLIKWKVPVAKLYMRPWGDNRPDPVVKTEILQQIIADGFNVYHAWDDRQAIIDVWESAGIPCTLVSEGGFSDADALDMSR